MHAVKMVHFNTKHIIAACFMAILLLGCSLTTSESDNTVALELTMYWEQLTVAHTTATTHWDTIIIGESMNCQVGLVVPTLLELTTTQLEAFPENRPIYDQLNLVVTNLQTTSQLWDTSCQQGVVNLPDATTAHQVLQTSEDLLSQAGNALTAQNP